MPKIKAFKGIRYNTTTVGIAAAICPPYDVIKASQVDAYYNKSPYNSIRLVLGQQFPKDTKTDNRYTRAKDFYHGWKNKGILIQDQKPAIYYHEQTYTMGDKSLTRKGIIAALKMDENDNYEIMPHEYTHKSPKIDRLRLMMEVKANLSCVFGIYSDKNKLIDTEIKPLLKDMLWDLTINEGTQKLWKIESPQLIKKIAGILSDKKILIADGHHRYDTARTYRDRMRASTGKIDGNQPFDYALFYLSNSEDGVSILPTHRVIVDSMGVGLVDIEHRVKELFRILPFDNRKTFLDSLKKNGKGYMGLRVKGIPRYYLLELSDIKALDRLMPDDSHPLLKTLDVNILHTCIIEPIVGIDYSMTAKRIEFISNASEALEMVEKEIADIVFLLNPSTIQDITAIAEAGLRMPQKSTFFYPKIPTGLVFYPLEAGAK
jgi:uncharacterized protein (DUF1015 family)